MCGKSAVGGNYNSTHDNKGTDGYGEYQKFDIQERWSYELYFETLKDIFWR